MSTGQTLCSSPQDSSIPTKALHTVLASMFLIEEEILDIFNFPTTTKHYNSLITKEMICSCKQKMEILLMTLGNIFSDNRSGILIPNFETGDLLYLKGESKLLLNEEAMSISPATKRAVSLEIKECIFVKKSLPFTFKFVEFSPFNPNIYNKKKNNISNKNDDNFASITHLRRETHDVATFTFKAKDNITYLPGQFVTFDFWENEFIQKEKKQLYESTFNAKLMNDDLMRTWTITSVSKSNDPENKISSNTFTITVKNSGGLVSSLLHKNSDQITLSKIRVLGTGGQFHLSLPNIISKRENNSTLKILFVAGGIGITPFISMINGELYGSLDNQNFDFKLFLVFKNIIDIPFVILEEILSKIENKQKQKLEVLISLTREDKLIENKNFLNSFPEVKVFNEKFDVEKLQSKFVEDLLERQVFICGPNPFMDYFDNEFVSKGVDSSNIHKEEFTF
eukprot:TRINITY_DN4312_c0_g1_i1.p1 TRINITY_DN4312_c0_g1~~TRINITY_DN4312_c0_g1_i1.p1  ORF type:complete len:453 (-),score=126.10 TRINITY_DN4312_c0_g1_i1:1-1359(-)